MEKNILLGNTMNLSQLTQMKSRQSSTLTIPSKNNASQAFDGILKGKLASNEPKVALNNKSSLTDIKESVRKSSTNGNKSNVVKAEAPKNDAFKKNESIDNIRKDNQSESISDSQMASNKTNNASTTDNKVVENKNNSKELETAEIPESVKKMLSDVENVLNLFEMILNTPDFKALEELSQVAVEIPKGTDMKAVVEQVNQLMTKVMEKLQSGMAQIDTTQMNGSSIQKLSELTSKVKAVQGDLQKLMTATFEKSDLKGFGAQLKEVLTSLKSESNSIQEQRKSLTDSLKAIESNKASASSFATLLKDAVETEGSPLKQNQFSLKGQQENTIDSKLAQNTFGKSNVPQESVKESKTAVTTQTQSSEMSQVRFENSMVSFSKQAIQVNENRVEQFKNIMEQMMNGVKTNLKQTETGSSMTLKLSPEHLGNVEVKLEMTKGTVLAEFKVENQMVKGALEANLSDLKNALADKGYQVENLNIFVDKDGRQQGKEQQQEHKQGHNKKESHDSDESNEKGAFNSFYEALNIIG